MDSVSDRRQSGRERGHPSESCRCTTFAKGTLSPKAIAPGHEAPAILGGAWPRHGIGEVSGSDSFLAFLLLHEPILRGLLTLPLPCLNKHKAPQKEGRPYARICCAYSAASSASLCAGSSGLSPRARFLRASKSRNSIWPLMERNSSWAQAASCSYSFAEMRSGICFLPLDIS